MTGLLVRFVLLCGFLFCAAWGATGHKVVAKIAYDHLTPKARAEVEKLLSGTTLADFSVWADQIKNEPAWAWSKTWHFADMPAQETEFKMDRDCPKEGCVVHGIQKYALVLSSKAASRDDKVQALKFLVHFVGDIHQPLHVGNKEDKGGGEIKVKLFSRDTNLHAVWDDAIIKRTGREYTSYASHLQDALTPELEKTHIAVMDPIAWATESHRIAQQHVYRIPSGETIKSGDTLGDDYAKASEKVVDEQLTKAGLRLAAMLNKIYDGPPEKPAEKKTPTPAPPKKKSK